MEVEVFYNLTLEMTCHHFHHMLLVLKRLQSQTNLGAVRRGIIQGCKYQLVKITEGPSWSLATTVVKEVLPHEQ